MSYMLDTDIFSYVVGKRHPEVRRRFSQMLDSICISAITYAEAVYGARKRGSDSLTSLVSLFAELVKILPWTDKAAKAYADIRCDLEKKGTPIGANDMLIAASALSSGSVLVTNNVTHFSRVQGLRIENWAVAPKGGL